MAGAIHEPMSLRERLEALARERARREGQLLEVRRETGEVLLEVREAIADLSLTEAAAILNLSRPTVYCLIEDAEASS